MSTRPVRDPRKEAVGWIQMASFIFLFPALFFFCVFLPIFLGWAPRFP